MKRGCSFFLLLSVLLLSPRLFSQQNLDNFPSTSNLEQDTPLKLAAEDVFIEQADEGGFFIWVRNRKDILSVMLTNHSKDPQGKKVVYSFRAPKYNIYNGDEKRMLNGEFINNKLHSLIDSSPESTAYFNEGAFRIYVPPTVIFGYPWTRTGQKELSEGSWINIRTFAMAHGDYRSSFLDNPFIIIMQNDSVTSDNTINSSDLKDKGTSRITQYGAADNATMTMAALFDAVDQTINGMADNGFDFALVIDASVSMRKEIELMSKELLAIIEQATAPFEHFRVGIVFYHNYESSYLTQVYPFSENIEMLTELLRKVEISASSNSKKALNEGIQSALTDLNWESSRRLLLQIGHSAENEQLSNQISQSASSLGVKIRQIRLKDFDDGLDGADLDNQY